MVTNSNVIKSINFNEEEILQNIIELYSPEGFEVDPCFSTGSFYRRYDIAEPKYKFDIKIQAEDVVEADCRDLPLEDNSVNSIIFDPPFVIGGKTYMDNKEGSSIIAKRFASFPSWDSLKEMYSGSLKEFGRILVDKGILAFKCQDCVAGGKQHLTHAWVIMEAVRLGFYPKDLFILMAKNRLIDGRKQLHSRKFHSYWLVFQKTPSKIDYFN